MGVAFSKPPAHNHLDAGFRAIESSFLRGNASAGYEIDDFETALANYLGWPKELVVSTASCTDAMTMAMLVLGSRKVLVPGLTWNATFNAALNAGAGVVLTDVNQYGVLDHGVMEDAEKLGCDTVLPVHLYGNSAVGSWYADVKSNTDVEHVVVDAAQALELPISPDADATCFSFHALKSLPLGHGGAIAFGMRHAEKANSVRRIRHHGMLHGQYATRTQVHVPAFKSVMLPPLAAMGSSYVPHVEKWLARRQEICATYVMRFATEGVAVVPRRDVADDAAHAFVVLPRDPDNLIRFLQTQEIGCTRYYQALRGQVKEWCDAVSDTSMSEWLGQHAVAIPMHAHMSNTDVTDVMKTVCAYGGDWV